MAFPKATGRFGIEAQADAVEVWEDVITAY